MSGRTFRFCAFVAAAVIVASAAIALVEPEPNAISAKTTRHPLLDIGQKSLPARNLPGFAGHADRLGSPIEGSLVDERTGRFLTLLPALPLVPGDGVGNSLSWSDLGRTKTPSATDVQDATRQAFRQLLADFGDVFRIDPDELGETRTTAFGTRFVQVWQGRQVNGVPVRESYGTAAVSHGNLVLFGTHNWGDVEVSTTPGLDTVAAEAVLRRHLEPIRWSGWRDRPRLELVPLRVDSGSLSEPVGQGLGYRLVWVLAPSFGDSVAAWEALVDAHTGELLSFEDTASYASTRAVVGGALPVTNDGAAPDGVEATSPMPFVKTTGGHQADTGGNFLSCIDGTITVAPLEGPYLKMVDTCGAFSESTAADLLDFGLNAGTDCAVPAGGSAGNTRSTRSGYHELNRIQEMARGQLPGNTWLQQQLTANMNIDATCNAGWNGSVNFFRSGGGCSNTGEIAGVFDHEWGHGMDANDNAPGISYPGEGIADIYAALRLDTSCIGRSFRATPCGGYGDPCTVCTGVRDIDWANRTSGAPHTFTWANATCGSVVHCRSYVYSEAVWDLWKRDLPSEYASDDNTAHEIVTRLTYLGAGNVTTWFAGGPPYGGCGATGGYLQYLAADDDNGNINDGTPHMQAIFDAFNRHEIACNFPTVTDSGCSGAPTMAPAVVGTAVDRGASLTWGAVTGATSYRIFRTDGVFGCDFGRTLVAETPALEFHESGLADGRAFYYQVAAMGTGETCYGPLSSCTAVTPTSGTLNPDLAIRTPPDSHFVPPPIGGDGDAFHDNCEPLRIDFDVENLSSVAATNLRIESVASNVGSVVSLESLPKLLAASAPAACGSPVHGHLFVEPSGMTHGDVLELTLSLTSDEISPATVDFAVQVPFVEIDYSAPSTETFDFESDFSGWAQHQGTIYRTAAGGGADGTDSYLRSTGGLHFACDRARSPLMRLNATSTLELYNNYEIESMSSGTWYDRANVAVLDGANRTVVEPSSGRTYNASSGGSGDFDGCNDGEKGWAGTESTWGISAWNATALGSAALAGQIVQLEITYATDGALQLDGFRFDQVTVTDAQFEVADGHSDVCAPVSDFLFADGFEGVNVLAWSLSAP